MTISVDDTTKRDYERILKRHLPITKLQTVVAKLANGESLPTTNRDHALTGNRANHRESHIAPDWPLIYQIKDDNLILEPTRTETRADLF